MFSLTRPYFISRPRTIILNPKFEEYVYFIYTPNFRSKIAVLGWKMKQGRFKESNRGALSGAEHGRAAGEHKGAPRE